MTFGDDRIDKKRAWIVFAILFVSFAWFYQGAGPNQNSRFDLVRAMVDRRTFVIDAYAQNTIDKAEANGHAYSDKAPGLAFASAPVYFVVRIAQRFATPSRDSARAALYVITIVVVGGASAAAGAFAYLFMRRLGIRAGPAIVAVIAFELGSNLFAYATLYVGHAFVAALALIAFALMQEGATRRRLAIAGLLAGWAAISEYPAAALAVFVFVYGWKRHGTQAMKPFIAGAVAPIALLLVYNTACFGSPFTLGYDRLGSETYRAAMARGFYGVALPSPIVMVRLLFSEHRGILPLAPWLVLVVPGLFVMFEDRARRAEARLVTAAVVFPLVLASSYAVWDGGMAMGPRHFVTALPFAAIATGFALDAIVRLPDWRRIAFASIAGSTVVYAIAICLACVAVMPEFVDTAIPIRVPDMAPPEVERPLTTFVMPLIARGYVSVKGTTPLGHIGYAIGFEGHDDDAINLGERMGLHGLASLVPLLIVWALGAFLFLRAQRSSR